MTLAFIWQGEPGGPGADGVPGKDGPRVSILSEEKQALPICHMGQSCTSTFIFSKNYSR